MNFSFTKRLILLIAFGAVSFLFLSLAITYYFTNYLVSNYEQEEIINNQRKVSQIYNHLELELANDTYDWANWDESYAFVNGKRPFFARENLTPNSLLLTETDAIVFLNESEEIVGMSSIESKIKKEKLVELIKPLLKKISETSKPSSYIILNDSVFMFSMQKISNSTSEAPKKGFLFFFKELNEVTLDVFETMSDIKISLKPIEPEKDFFNTTLNIKNIFNDNFTFYLSIKNIISPISRKIYLLRILITLIMLPLLTVISLLYTRAYFTKPIDNLKHEILTVLQDENPTYIAKTNTYEINDVIESINKVKKRNLQLNLDAQKQRVAVLHNQRLQTIGEMASGFAHEINNPLAIIKGKIGLLELKLRASNLFDENAAYFESCYSTIRRITAIISSLKNFSRGESENVFESISADELLSGALELSSSILKYGACPVTLVNINSQHIFCKPIQIQQVITNLISNSAYALKMEPSPWIRIELSETSDYFIFNYSDAGLGIDPSIADKIFDPFFTTKPTGDGTGIGLSISADILKQHNGIIYLEKQAANTTFVFKIPKKKVS